MEFLVTLQNYLICAIVCLGIFARLSLEEFGDVYNRRVP